MADYTQTQVETGLKNLGNYRVRMAQEVALEGPADAFSGALLLALGLRETGLRNINNPANTDHGCFQVSEIYHASWLLSQPGCPVGSWVTEGGHSAVEDRYAPRYTPACLYALQILKDNWAFAVAKGVDLEHRLEFSVAAYNAGGGGALAGYREGNVDKYTTLGNYSAWVIAHRAKINRFLNEHPSWRP